MSSTTVGEAVCRALPHSLEACFGDEGLASRGEEIGAMQNLCVPVQDSWDIVITEQAR